MTSDRSNDVVTLLIRHRVKEGNEQAYERWLHRTVEAAKGYPGHLGIDVMREQQGSQRQFTCVLRFANPERLHAWLESDERRGLIEQVRPLLADGDRTEINPDREFWFSPALAGGAEPPPRWKQACVTFLVILPLSLLIPQLWQPVFVRAPWLGGYLPSNVLITLSIVLLVVYFFMPTVTRWLSPWLNAR
ncbi:antibiotic biosynthesis monooxygenase [Stutzerimonas azotifigens]|uniref:antibiotic biosynthesis monooxygenase n=1 Tax=Stutzerimonas azotifigens TaxID=291995 RepID=UPI000403FFFD|nr:antibiotic biosynthesis monooxygenase [Stutzerimonas azotifigens]